MAAVMRSVRKYKKDLSMYLKLKLHNIFSDTKFIEILVGSVWAFGSRVISTLFGMACTIIVAKFYGAKVLGNISIVQSFIGLATLFTVMGMNTSILKLIPEHIVKYSYTSAFKIYRKIFFMVIASSVIAGIFLYYFSNDIARNVFKNKDLAYYLAISAMFVVFKSLVDINTNSVRSLRLIKSFALMQSFPQFINIIFLILFGIFIRNMDVPVYSLLGSYFITGLVGCLIAEYSFKKKMVSYDTVKNVSAKDILSISLPMLMTATMTFVIGQTGVLMLGVFRPEADVGYYAVAVKLATLTTFILTAVGSMAAPKFSELFHVNKMDELFYVARKSTKLIFWTTVPILIFLILLGDPLLIIMFGLDFEVAYMPMLFLIIGQFFNSISGSTAIFMNMTGNHKEFRNIIIFSALLNIVLNILLIPSLGILGSALSAMSSMIAWNVATLLFIKNKYNKSFMYLPILNN